MTGRAIITDKAAFATLWASSMTCVQIGKLYGVSAPGVSEAAKRFGLPGRSSRRGQSQKWALSEPAQESASNDPALAQMGRLKRAWAERSISGRQAWSLARDKQILRSGGTYADLCELAFEFDVTYAAVIARWHIVRKVRGYDPSQG